MTDASCLFYICLLSLSDSLTKTEVNVQRNLLILHVRIINILNMHASSFWVLQFLLLRHFSFFLLLEILTYIMGKLQIEWCNAKKGSEIDDLVAFAKDILFE